MVRRVSEYVLGYALAVSDEDGHWIAACPERESDVKALVKTGRLQVGPWYVLADEQIPSGEALVRNLLLGAADAERWGGGRGARAGEAGKDGGGNATHESAPIHR